MSTASTALNHGRGSECDITPSTTRAEQTAALLDSITGNSRGQLEGLPVAVIYNRLCDQLLAMGLQPAEAKVLRIATWINGAEPVD